MKELTIKIYKTKPNSDYNGRIYIKQQDYKDLQDVLKSMLILDNKEVFKEGYKRDWHEDYK